jgi:hypothetical protein
MKKAIKFLIYKLFRLAKMQEQTVPLNVSFLVNISLFEIIHLAILIVLFKIVGYDLPQYNDTLFAIFAIGVGFIFNYYLFIKNGKIYKINEYFQENGCNKLKGNLFFFGYIIFLFLLILLETKIIQDMNK